jgi:serine/threonine protein phosphatase 1
MLRWWQPRTDRQVCVPPDMRIYAIGDIHGCADLLERAFSFIDHDLRQADGKRIVQVFLGDYVDRGPDSSRTLDLLIERTRYHEVIFIRGNHEQLLLDFIAQPSVLSDWWPIGGAQTLMSYGLAPRLNCSSAEEASLRDALVLAMPPSHRAFLASLRSAYICGDFFFTHAGVRPGVALELQSEDDLMWIREPFLSSHTNFGKMVVHGHTPVREPEIHDHRINLDTGAYATGRLTVLSIEEHRTQFHCISRSEVSTVVVPVTVGRS